MITLPVTLVPGTVPHEGVFKWVQVPFYFPSLVKNTKYNIQHTPIHTRRCGHHSGGQDELGPGQVKWPGDRRCSAPYLVPTAALLRSNEFLPVFTLYSISKSREVR